MDCILCVWMEWLMSVASRGCYPYSGPAGTPLGHLWSHMHALLSHTLRWHMRKLKHFANTLLSTRYTTITADIIITMVGQRDRGATKANLTQRLDMFTVHEAVVMWQCCCCWDRILPQATTTALPFLLQTKTDLNLTTWLLSWIMILKSW